MADYKLADLLGIAGATIGIIIAGGIVLGNLGAKYIAIFERYRGLTGEYRANDCSDIRRESLETQITSYGKQISYLNYATMFVTVALLVFLITIGVASLSVMFPKLMILRALGSITLFGGLSLIGVSFILQLLEALVQRRSIRHEVADLSNLPSVEEALRR